MTKGELRLKFLEDIGFNDNLRIIPEREYIIWLENFIVNSLPNGEALNAKDKKIIEDAEREGIPIFVFTAKDKFSLDTILDYEVKCVMARCSLDHTEGIHARIHKFEAWQKDNPSKVKLPD